MQFVVAKTACCVFINIHLQCTFQYLFMLSECIKLAHLSCRLNRSLLDISTKLFPEKVMYLNMKNQ